MAEKMNPEIKQVWIDALRSGDYEQGQGNLRSGDKFCCLGVLCDLAIKAGQKVEVKELPPYYTDDSSIFLYDGDQGCLPESVMEWAGLKSENPVMVVPEDYPIPPYADMSWYDGTEALGGLNDGGYTFNQIANLIDVQL